MNKSQMERVKQLAWRSVSREFFEPIILAVAIRLITHKRVSQEFEMHPDLVGSPRVKPRLDQGRCPQSLKHFVAGVRLPAVILVHSHAFAM